MDIEPIYCAEQIVVPPDLADVLKAYTKEVIRNQPADIVGFSAKYFAQLAEQRRKLQSLTSPGMEQLQLMYSTLRNHKPLTTADLLAGAEASGIPSTTVTRVLEAGRVAKDKHINLMEVITLLLSMSCDGLASTLRGAFEVLGGSVDAELPMASVLDLLEVVGARDPELGTGVVAAVQEALAGQLHVSYPLLQGVPVLAPKLLS